MTDPFGGTAAAIGLAISAVQIAQAIRGLVSEMKNVSKSLNRLEEELSVFKMILTAASEVGSEYEYVESALRDCKRELGKIYERVLLLCEKAQDEKLRKISIGTHQLHREEKELRSLLHELERRKMTVVAALMVANSAKDLRKGKKLERRLTNLQGANADHDQNHIDAEQMQENIVLGAIEDIQGMMEEDPDNVLCALQQLDRPTAQELWKLDRPALNKIKHMLTRYGLFSY
ncbi:hypothetical protein K440DRAFT_632739 [Wilcoxina mikolae CBS 423.85]|nr:hypothetical protein K440DRAFT_632739 [Wilcoxina mikolae CBS 423.85]